MILAVARHGKRHGFGRRLPAIRQAQIQKHFGGAFHIAVHGAGKRERFGPQRNRARARRQSNRDRGPHEQRLQKRFPAPDPVECLDNFIQVDGHTVVGELDGGCQRIRRQRKIAVRFVGML